MKKRLIATLITLGLLFLATNSASANEALSGKIALTINTNNPSGSGWQNTQRDIFLLDLATGDLTNITRTAGEEMMPRISPDGQEILFGAFDQNLNWHVRKYAFSNGGLETLWQSPKEQCLPLGWHHDGQILIQRNFAIYLSNTQFHTSSRLLKIESLPALVCLSPDGQRLYYEYHNLERYQSRPGHESEDELPGVMEIRRLDIRSHKTVRICDGREPDLSPDGKILAYVYGDGAEISGLYLYDFSSKPRKIAGPGAECPRFSPDGQHLAYLDTRSYQKVDIVIIRLSNLDVVRRIPVGPAQGMDW